MSDVQGGDYETATNGAVIVPLRDWSTLRVTGADRAAFLHNMCTNDVKGLTAGRGCEAFFTDVKGKIVGHAFLLADDSAIRIVGVPRTAERLMKQLDRYIIREDVTLSDESPELTWLLLFGKQADGVLERSLGIADGQLPEGWSHRSVAVDGIGLLAVRCPLPWMGGVLIRCPASAADTLASRLRDAGAVAGAGAWFERLRVESNWPLWGVDFDDSNLPQEVARDAQAISFRKGCYLGQETVARIDALGHVNKQLIQVLFEGDEAPVVGDELFNGDQSVGRVTSACTSSRWGSPAAIAMVRRGSNAAGTSLRWSGGAARVFPAPGSAGA